MIKQNLSIKETFALAAKNYKENNFKEAEMFCKKIFYIKLSNCINQSKYYIFTN